MIECQYIYKLDHTFNIGFKAKFVKIHWRMLPKRKQLENEMFHSKNKTKKYYDATKQL